MKLLCRLGIHSYIIRFIPFADQPFLTNNVEDDMCGVEGRYVKKCKRCGEKGK